MTVVLAVTRRERVQEPVLRAVHQVLSHKPEQQPVKEAVAVVIGIMVRGLIPAHVRPAAVGELAETTVLAAMAATVLVRKSKKKQHHAAV